MQVTLRVACFDPETDERSRTNQTLSRAACSLSTSSAFSSTLRSSRGWRGGVNGASRWLNIPQLAARSAGARGTGRRHGRAA
jgi:hypothetical protein